MGSEGGNSRYAAQHVIFVRPSHTDADAMKYLKALRGNNTNPTDATLEAFVKGARENINYMKFLGAKDPKVEIRAEYPDAPDADSIGSAMVHSPGGGGTLYALIQENVNKRKGNIDVWCNAPGKKLIQDPQTGIIHGVIIEVNGTPKYVRAKNGVILATGGYEDSPDMFRNFAIMQHAYSKGACFNTGDGIVMADDVQANIVNMGNNNGPDHNVIMVGQEGKRFWNEAQKTRHGRVAGANATVVKSDVSQESVLGGKPGFRPDETAPLYQLQPSEKLGIGRGMGGVIAIAVKTDGGKIVSIRVLNQHETPGIGGKPIAILPNEAVDR